MFLHDVKISTKLFLAFGIFIVLMVVSSSLSLFSLNRANNGMQDIVNRDYPTTVKANQLIENFQEFVSTQQLMVLDTDGKWSGESQKHLTALSGNITVLLDDLSSALRDRDSQRILSELRQIRQQYLDSRFRILEAVKNKDTQAAVEEMMNNTLPVQRAYKEKVQQLIAVQDNNMRSAGKLVEHDFKSNRTMLVLLALISIGLGSLMGWLIVRAITRPLVQAVQFAEAIAGGDLTQHIDVKHRDETGVLLSALVAMKSRLF